MKLFNLENHKYSTSKKYLLIIIFFVGTIVYLYQEPILFGERLNIGDVRSQGIIFDQYKTDYLKSDVDDNDVYLYLCNHNLSFLIISVDVLSF